MRLKERIKGLIAGLLIGVIAGSFVAVASVGTIEKIINYNNIKIKIDDVAVFPTDANGNYVEPFVIDGTTFLPLRGVANLLGLKVEWDNKTKTVNLYSEKDKIEKLTVATNASFPPFEYYDNNNSMTGIDIEIMQELSKNMNMDVEFVDMDFQDLIISVANQKADCAIAGITVTDERKELVSFSKPYYINTAVVIVDKNSNILSLDNLYNSSRNYSVGAVENSTEAFYGMSEFANNFMCFDSTQSLLMALQNGSIDAAILNNRIFDKYIGDKAAYLDLSILPENYFVEEYAIAVDKNDTDLLKKINESITELSNNGTIETIVSRYID